MLLFGYFHLARKAPKKRKKKGDGGEKKVAGVASAARSSAASPSLRFRSVSVSGVGVL